MHTNTEVSIDIKTRKLRNCAAIDDGTNTTIALIVLYLLLKVPQQCTSPGCSSMTQYRLS